MCESRGGVCILKIHSREVASLRVSRPRKGSPKGRFQTQCLLRCYLKILEERSEPPTPQRSGRAGEEKGRGKEGKGGDAMRGRKGKGGERRRLILLVYSL